MPRTIIYCRVASVRRSIQQQGQTVNEELLIECAKQSSAELESEFLYLINDTGPFDLEAIETANPDTSNKNDLSWFVQLNNELCELYFWQKANPSPQNYERLEYFTKEKLPELVTRRFKSPPAQTQT